MATIDPRLFEELAQSAAQPAAAAVGGAPSPEQSQQQPAAPQAGTEGASSGGGTPYAEMDPVGKVGGAIVAGVGGAINETKDFLFGAPAESEKSGVRKGVEQLSKDVRKAGAGYGLVEGVAQFATGMLGLGKVLAVSKFVPGVAGAAGAVGRAATAGSEAAGAAASGAMGAGTTVGATVGRGVAGAAAESAKAAAVGAVAFDPHQERLSNLIEQYPTLSGPVTRYLAAKPGDSVAEGRFKNALESIGMDAVLVPVFKAAVAVGKAVHGGDAAAQKAATKELEKALQDQEAASAARTADTVSGEVPAGAAEAPAPVADRSGGVAGEPGLAGEGPVPRDGEVSPRTAEDPGLALGGEAQAGAEGGPLAVTVKPSGVEGALPVEGGATPGSMEGAFGPSTPGTPTFDIQPGIGVEQVSSPSAAGAPSRQAPLIDLGPGHSTDGFVQSMKADEDAFRRYGSWEEAVEDGYQFGKGGNVPWQKLALNTGDGPRTTVDALLSSIMEADAAGFNRAKGGAVLTDNKRASLAKNWYNMYDLDPAETVGALVRAGKEARFMAAKMDAAFSLGQRAFLDAQAIAQEIRMGNFSRWGTPEAARDGMASALQMGSDLFASALSMRASAGRTVRGNRLEFAVDAETLGKMRQMDPQMLAELVSSTGGNPKAMRQLTKAGLWNGPMDFAQYLYINSLLWGPTTHFINVATNTVMAIQRPLERIIGSVAVRGTEGARIRQEALRQYYYMGSSLSDSFRGAVDVWRLGDSTLTPRGASGFDHMSGSALEHNAEGTAAITQADFRPNNSLADLGYNAGIGAAKAIGLPTRMLGAMDELFKGITYRGKVGAQAYVEGMERGLKDQDLADFVSKSLREAFDDSGKALNVNAIQEARSATFQQDLLPGTLGAGISQFVNNFPAARFILPFVRTPTNVLRMGWAMTPVLNLAQKEFRQSLMGKLGPEKQAQAAGQMTLGTLFLGSAATAVTSGRITGGGPNDPNLKKQLQATGWRPYSIVVPGKDGGPATYIPYNRYDPVALPIGLIADVVDIAHSNWDSSQGWGTAAQEAAEAAFVGLVKNLDNKSYLISLQKFLEAANSGMSAEPGEKGARFIGGVAAGMTPFSAGLRFANQTMGDPYLREARSVVDNIAQNIPGLSGSLPARYDTWGDPVTVHPGLWQYGSAAMVDRETERMTLEANVGFGAPAPTLEGVDLREITLKNGKNAYEAYQQLMRQPTPRVPTMKEAAAKIMELPAYAKAPDGESGTKGTKQYMVFGVISKYRQAALKQIKADENVRLKLMEKTMAVRKAYQNRDAQQANPTGAAMQTLTDTFGRM